MITFQHDIRTSGDGWWSGEKKVVEVVGMEIRALEYSTDAGMRRYGELCVYFNTESWDIYEDGLVYTDAGFMKKLCKLLAENGITEKPSYSEQGMQGKDYVSMDVDEKFIKQFDRAFSVTTFYRNCDHIT